MSRNWSALIRARSLGSLSRSSNSSHVWSPIRMSLPNTSCGGRPPPLLPGCPATSSFPRPCAGVRIGTGGAAPAGVVTVSPSGASGCSGWSLIWSRPPCSTALGLAGGELLSHAPLRRRGQLGAGIEAAPVDPAAPAGQPDERAGAQVRALAAERADGLVTRHAVSSPPRDTV